MHLLEPAEFLPGASAGGWDISHGAPYQSYAYERDGGWIAMVATFADGDDVALGLIFTEEQEALAPEATTVGGWPVLVYPSNSRGTSAVLVENICGQYDLWAFWSSPDTATITIDVVWIADVADCSTG